MIEIKQSENPKQHNHHGFEFKMSEFRMKYTVKKQFSFILSVSGGEISLS